MNVTQKNILTERRDVTDITDGEVDHADVTLAPYDDTRHVFSITTKRTDTNVYEDNQKDDFKAVLKRQTPNVKQNAEKSYTCML